MAEKPEEKQEEKKLLKCTRCTRMLEPEKFYKNKKYITGRNTRCRECDKETKKVLRMKKRDAIDFATLESKSSKLTLSGGENELETFDINKEVIKEDGSIKHFSAIMVAQSQSGKTILMMHLIDKLRKHYDLVILVTKNLQAESYDLSKFDFATNEMFLDKLIYSIRYFQRMTNNYFSILLIIDDLKTRMKTTVQELFTNGRNSGISIMNLVQLATMVDNTMRCNCKYIFLFNQKNPEMIHNTIQKFLNNFVKTPTYLNRNERALFLENWLQSNTKDYTSIVLNMTEGKIQKIKAPYNKK